MLMYVCEDSMRQVYRIFFGTKHDRSGTILVLVFFCSLLARCTDYAFSIGTHCSQTTLVLFPGRTCSAKAIYFQGKIKEIFI